MKRAWRGIHWYLRELTGETQYDRYLARHGREHPGREPQSRRDFERARVDRTDTGPGGRCC